MFMFLNLLFHREILLRSRSYVELTFTRGQPTGKGYTREILCQTVLLGLYSSTNTVLPDIKTVIATITVTVLHCILYLNKQAHHESPR